MKTFYVTTPIYYANSLPHMGHLYTTVVADFLTRHQRQRGSETYFLTGTDEHGTNIERASAKAGRTPRAHVDYVVGELKKMFAAFGLDGEHGGYDIFMRTTEPFHYEGAQEFWRRAAARPTPKGRENIYKGFYEGWFCAPCATFKTEAEMIPAVEEGGQPLCPIHERPLDKVSEESYFFRLSDYDEALLEFYESRPDFVRPEARRNEVISLVRGGLEDVSISRLKSSVSWAIPVPDDPQHTVYIWFDALINYITALGWGSEQRKQEAGADLFEKFWPGVHLIGKDILRQHAVLWPAMLLAADVELPRAVVAHGLWLDQTGRKGSKTLGNALELPTLLRHFKIDAVRYFLLREMSFGQDCKVDYEVILDRSNSDLASGFGNLVSRTLTMIHKYCDGVIPTGVKWSPVNAGGPLTYRPDLIRLKDMEDEYPTPITEHTAFNARFEQHVANYHRYVESYDFSRALEAVWRIISETDKFISDYKPWELVKDESQRWKLNAVLYISAEVLRWLAALLYPVMPQSTQVVWEQLGQTEDLSKQNPQEFKWGGLDEGLRVGEVLPLFPRIDKAKTMAEIEKEMAERKESQAAEAVQPAEAEQTGVHATQAAVPGAPTAAGTEPAQPPQQGATEAAATPEGVTTYIAIEDFVKVELRVGEVLTAERIPKSDKLLRFTVDLGEPEPRQILAGIAEHYEPEQVIGRKLVIVSNLKPRKLRGFESQGMVLAASVGEEGRPVLATFTEDVPNGTRLK